MHFIDGYTCTGKIHQYTFGSSVGGTWCDPFSGQKREGSVRQEIIMMQGGHKTTRSIGLGWAGLAKSQSGRCIMELRSCRLTGQYGAKPQF